MTTESDDNIPSPLSGMSDEDLQKEMRRRSSNAKSAPKRTVKREGNMLHFFKGKEEVFKMTLAKAQSIARLSKEILAFK